MAYSKEAIEQAERLWEEWAPVINRSLISYEADPALRQDLSQNVFIALLSVVNRIEDVRNMKAYILRIVHNVATSHIAKEAKRKWQSLDADETALHRGISDSVGFNREQSEAGGNPEQQLSREDSSQQLLAAVRRLKLPYRQVMVLLLEDFTDAEIGEILGISHGNVRVRINRAKAQLTEMIKS